MSDYVRPTGGRVALSQTRDASDDDEEVRSGGGGGGGTASGRTPGVAISAAGEPASGSSSGARKPRGRPPGSKDKPNPPVESEADTQVVRLHFADGSDIMEGIYSFAARRRVGVSLLSVTGGVANVSLRRINSTFSLPDRYKVLYLKGSLDPPSAGAGAAAAAGEFDIIMEGPQGQMIVGTVAGPLIAAGPVVLTALRIARMEYYTVPAPAEENAGTGSPSGARKLRGWLPWSKNKPKPPVESEEDVQRVSLHFADGSDIMEGIYSFAARRRVGVSLLSVTGAVANVTLLRINSTISLPGRYDVVALEGTLDPPAAGAAEEFNIMVKGPQGQTFAGTVAGPLVAAGPVVLRAHYFAKTEHYTLPAMAAAAIAGRGGEC